MTDNEFLGLSLECIRYSSVKHFTLTTRGAAFAKFVERKIVKYLILTIVFQLARRSSQDLD